MEETRVQVLSHKPHFHIKCTMLYLSLTHYFTYYDFLALFVDLTTSDDELTVPNFESKFRLT